jgi:hypothetical protein
MKSVIARLLALVLLLAATGIAFAFRDVSLTSELRRLVDIEAFIKNLPEYQQAEELKEELNAVRARLDALQRLPESERDELEVLELRAMIADLERRLASARKIVADFREQVDRAESTRHFPNVRHRVAVFTFDDPHATGLGDPVSFLLSKKLLFSTRVSSFGIVNYRQGVEGRAPGELAYFDRVDALTRHQKYLLAMWGRIAQTTEGVRIDSFLQVPAGGGTAAFVRSVQLPRAMGGGRLTVRLKPERIQVQRLDIKPDEVRALQKAASEVATLRAQPDVSAAVTGRLAEGPAYSIAGSRAGWVRLEGGRGGGWTSVDAFCRDACRDLMDAATFFNDVVAFTSRKWARLVPASLTREARAVADQLRALDALRDYPSIAIEVAERWVTGRSGGPAPGGAAFANLLAVARVKSELDRAGRATSFDGIRLNRESIERVAQQLAEASLADPNDLDVIENLALLFAYLGDERRRNLALEIAANLRTRPR